MAQQTGVEWLDNELWKLRLKLRGGEISIKFYLEQEARLILQAKEMEKQQIVKAHREQSYLQDDGSWLELTGEQYYTETYTTRLQNETN
jgi:hypothetical protein